MSTPNLQIQGGNFQDAEGNVLNAGYLLFQLSHDENYASGPSQIVAGLKFKITLNSTGNVPASPATMIYSNDVLLPSGSYYIIRAFKSDGTEAWAAPQNVTFASSPNPYDLGNIVPSNPPGSGLSSSGGSTLLLQTNGTANSNQALLNLAQGTNVTISNSAGTTTISAQGGGTFSTSGQGWFAGPGMTDASSILMNSATNHLINYSANTVVVFQFVLQASWALSKVAYRLTATGGAGSKFSFGIYNVAGTTKLVDSGALDGTISTLQTASFGPTTLNPGTYYFATTSTDSGINGPCAQVGSVPIQIFAMINAANPLWATAANAATSGVLPATLGVLTNASGATVDSMPLPIWLV